MEKVYEEFFNKNRTLYSLDGELDPKLYSGLIERFSSEIKNINWNIICDPYVAVEDEIFRKYHKIRSNELAYWWFAEKSEDFWKAHPLFDLAHNNNKIKIMVSKQRIEPHFLMGSESNALLVEEPHLELEEVISKKYLNNQESYDNYLQIWKNKLKNCYDWQEKSKRVFFKPRTIFEQENKVLEELNQEDKVTILD
ncbi:hypothetical protein J4403_04640 [Candidatus Woesearchaeota archaeon]|nr:hypothetical protein [Candidatus Woesearchaeota archaeon]